MATTRIAKVSNTINSSYVLIENASFRSRLGNGGIHTLSAPQVSILYCHGATKPKWAWLSVNVYQAKINSFTSLEVMSRPRTMLAACMGVKMPCARESSSFPPKKDSAPFACGVMVAVI